MKLRAIFVTIGVLAILSVGIVIGATTGSAAPDLAPQLAQVGTAFTYQGLITDTGSPANGTYDFSFKLFNDASDGTQVGSTVTKNAVTVVDGYFTVELDFGDWFDGTALWLAIEVQGPGDSGFTALSPRQPLRPTPYAINADKIDGLDSGDLYTQAEVDALLAAYDSRITALEGKLASVSTENSGQDVVFTGVNVHVRSGSGATGGAINGLGNLIVGYNEDGFAPTATRTGSHNLVVGPEHSYSSYGGFLAGYQNIVSGSYASVSGGRDNTASGNSAAISGGNMNTASGPYSSVSAGQDNTASGLYSSVSAGDNNTASGDWAAVSGGINNIAFGDRSSISGGLLNSANSGWSSISGGINNTTSGNYASISGGSNNTASGSYASVNGGRYNTASGINSTVLGGGGWDSTFGNEAWAYFSVVAGGAANVAGNDSGTDRSVGQASAVLAGFSNDASDDYASASGGINNTASGLYSSVSGGVLNSANGDWSSVLGGVTNTASGDYSSVSAGEDNTAGGSYASVSGGLNNAANGIHSTVGGGANDSVTGGADWRAGELFQEN
jgi:hypothetical protein